MKPVLVPALAAALALAAGAAAAPKSSLQITRAWSRPAAAGTNGVGYLTVANSSGKADAIVRIESPLAAQADMHATSMAGGVMSMQRMERVPVPAHGQVSFAPGGRHIMLMGLTRALNVGDEVPATLTFASGARVKLAFKVAVTPPAM